MNELKHIDRKKQRKGRVTKQPESKQQNGNSKFVISNNTECK